MKIYRNNIGTNITLLWKGRTRYEWTKTQTNRQIIGLKKDFDSPTNHTISKYVSKRRRWRLPSNVSFMKSSIMYSFCSYYNCFTMGLHGLHHLQLDVESVLWFLTHCELKEIDYLFPLKAVSQASWLYLVFIVTHFSQRWLNFFNFWSLADFVFPATKHQLPTSNMIKVESWRERKQRLVIINAKISQIIKPKAKTKKDHKKPHIISTPPATPT